jgi:hypothetical protein
MEDELVNRVGLVKNLKTLLKICCELIDDETFHMVYFSEELPQLREKLTYFGIDSHFNFLLWRRLEKFKEYFDWMKISKKLELKQKRYSEIVELIPDVGDIFLETHLVFDFFKEALLEFLGKIDLSDSESFLP